MKKLVFLLIFVSAVGFLVSCNQAGKTDTKVVDSLLKDTLELATSAVKKIC